MTIISMRPMLRVAVYAALAVALGAADSPREAAPLSHLFSASVDVPLGKATDRIDYQTVDEYAAKLYIAKMGAGALLAFDLTTNKVTAELPGFPKVTGVLVVPKLHRLYASVPGAGIGPSVNVALGMAGLSSGSGAVSILDTDDLHEIARLPGGVFPDGIAYDDDDGQVFVSDELGAAITVLDAKHDRLIGRIDTGGEVGNVQYDTRSGMVYAPIQTRNEMIVIDPKNDKVVDRYKLPGADHPHGLLISPDAAVGYVACDGNDRLLTVDLTDGRVLGRLRIGHDPDVLAIDPGAKRLYVASESGNLSVFDVAKPDTPVPLGETFLGHDAHTVAVDRGTHLLYLPIADQQGRAVLRVVLPVLNGDVSDIGSAMAARPIFRPGWPGRN